MKIKIISDGSWQNTKIVNADTGEQIDNITEMYIFFEAGKPTTVMLTLDDPDMGIDTKDFAEVDK